MLHDLYRFLYITNREVTVLILCAMFPLDLILFVLMARYGRAASLIFGGIAIVNFAWAFSWFKEPVHGQSLEPILREFAQFMLLIGKGFRIMQFYGSRSAKIILTVNNKPLSRQERAMGLLVGLGGGTVSIAVAIGFWLFTAYQNHEQKEDIKIESIQTQTLMIAQFSGIMARFEHKADSLLLLGKQNHKGISEVKEQGRVGIAIAQQRADQAARTANQVARKLSNKEAAEKRGKTIPADKIEKNPKEPAWYERLFKKVSQLRLPPPPDGHYPSDSTYAKIF